MASYRYASTDSSSSAASRRSDPSPPSSGHKNPAKIFSSKHLSADSGDRRKATPMTLMKRPTADLDPAKTKNDHSFGTMVKKFMEKRSSLKPGSADRTLVLPKDVIARDAKKSGTSNGSNLSVLHRKLFQKGGSADQMPARKALMEVKPNTRTLAMVLHSERELMSQNKEYGAEIAELQLQIGEKDLQLDQLKSLCLKQREEIKALKDAILFPDLMNSQLHDLLEKRGSELKLAKQSTLSLQKQVKAAEKYTAGTCFGGDVSSPRTPSVLNHQGADSSLEYSSGDPFTCECGSPYDMVLQDLNPCLTPFFSRTKI